MALYWTVGTGASGNGVAPLDFLSAEDIGNIVAAVGPPYIDYY